MIVKFLRLRGLWGKIFAIKEALVSEIDKDMCHFFEQKEWDKEITPCPFSLKFSSLRKEGGFFIA